MRSSSRWYSSINSFLRPTFGKNSRISFLRVKFRILLISIHASHDTFLNFQLRKRNPSPTPSAVSSASSTSHHSNNIHHQNNNTTNSNSDPTKKGLNTSGNSLGVNTSFANQSAVLNSLSPSHPKFGTY